MRHEVGEKVNEGCAMKTDGLMVEAGGLEYADRGRAETLSPQGAAVRLVYDDAGTGDPAVVLVHGWGFGNPSIFVPQSEHLATRRRVLKLDLPGHGRSALPPPGFGFKDCAAAIVAQMDAAGVDLVCVQVAAPLTYRLAEGGRWREVYRDDFAVIFERATPLGR